MLDLPKLIQLLPAWLSDISLEELTSAEVEKGRGSYQKVFNQGIAIIGNHLVLEKTLFQQLQQQARACGKQGHPQDFQMAVASPQIYLVQGKGKEQKVKYLPLFTIEISQIFLGNYRQRGWDLTEFEWQPVTINLMRLYNLEEEEAESLIVTEGLSQFLEDTFKRHFSNLQAFTEQVDLPERYYKSARSPYLVRFNLVPYNAQLKQDLRDSLKQLQENPSDCFWLSDAHPVLQYLFGQPQPPRQETLFLGAFPAHPPDSCQAQVLKHVQSNSLTAVWGAPGTGKTETQQHLLALELVKRALHLAQTGADRHHLIVFATSNNSPLRKFQQRLELPNLSDPLYLPGGSQWIARTETLPALQKAIDRLRQAQFNPQEYDRAKQALIEAEHELQRLFQLDQSQQRQREETARQLEQLAVELQAVNEQMARVRAEQQRLTEQLSRWPDYSLFPQEAYQQIQAALVRTEQELPKAEDALLKRALDWLDGVTDERVFEGLGKRINTPVLNTLATPFPFQTPVNREQLLAALRSVSQQLESFASWQDLRGELARQQEQLAELEQQLAALTTQQSQLQQQLSDSPTEDFSNRFYRDYHPQQVQLFHRAIAFLQQEALRRSQEVIQALETYGSALSGEVDALLQLEANGPRIYRDLSLKFPVLTCTLQSVRNLLPHLQPNLVKLALVDEAGSTPLHQLFPLLVRSQQAVVAGDPKQIEPVINLCDDTIKQYRQQAFLDQGLSDEDYYRYAPTAKYTATAYHRAAGANGIEGDLGTGIVLRNHYRSPASIMGFCRPNYPDGLLVKTPDRPSALGTNLIAYHVSGEQVNKTNPQEIKAIEIVIEFLLQQGYSLNELGVMSPYWQQAKALRYRLQSHWKNFHRDDINTVHQFQSGQKKVIIFSPYQCRPDHSFWFINRKPNLLNAAVSRTQELFIVVGNLKALEKAGGEIQRLIQHIRQDGEIRDLPSSAAI